MAGIDEDTTRRELVERALRDARWPVLDYSGSKSYRTAAVREYETAHGPADYILFYESEALAAVEAKRLGLGPQNVLSQAKRYAKGYQGGSFVFGEFHLPFIYSTNGIKFWFQDLRQETSRSREISKFHTPLALKEMLNNDSTAAAEWLQQNPNDNPFLRPYQRESIAAIEYAVRMGKRKMLLAMATGTGKTFVAVSLIYRLLKSGFAKRILFLVDRRALAAQAVGAFAAFEPEPGLKFDRIYEVYSQRFRREDLLEESSKFDINVIPNEYLTDPKPHHSFVYICTIQRMMINLFGKASVFEQTSGELEDESDADILPVPIHAFDFIVADECHRGYTSTEEGKWREVLEHFDAIKIGLTATPAAHTTAYFEDIVYRYDYERAVREGYLVDYDAIDIKSDITMKGLFLKEGEEITYIDRTSGVSSYDVLEDERTFETNELEQKAAAPDRNRRIVKEVATYIRKQEEELGRFPKTLVFAVNDLPHVSHADQLVNILRDEFGRGDAFVEKITGSPTVDRPLQRIREFRNRPLPAVAVTVDMLTTGVDIPKLENLVFLRPVKSRILFTQMLGRGTRKCQDINKTHFTVYDCFDGTLLEYFRRATEFTADPPTKPTRAWREIIDSIYGNKDRQYNAKVLIRRLRRIEKDVSAEGREMFAKFIPDGDVGSFAQSLPERLQTDWTNTMLMLRNPEFQNLLEDYPRADKTFVVAQMAQDTVTSEYMFRTNDGKALKPEDYLIAFERFVKENPDHIEALRLLLNKPKDFGTRELSDLRKKLEARPEHFTEENLRKAYHNELADVISIIRHAAAGEPLLTAEERVDRAIAKIKGNKKFNPEQEKWLELVRNHSIRELLLEERDFNLLPFSRHGGWYKANAVFQGELIALIHEINAQVITA
ncbi:MAG: type I restriction-modification enzyme R subunit C-terminal domain-containing protein [Promethearchaeati archaeon SRVP18_Atabeyarchaeia-1]